MGSAFALGVEEGALATCALAEGRGARRGSGLTMGRVLAVVWGRTLGRGADASRSRSSVAGSTGEGGEAVTRVSGGGGEFARGGSLVSFVTVPTSTLLVIQGSAVMDEGSLGSALECAAQAATSIACSAMDASSAQGKGSRDVRLTLDSVVTLGRRLGCPVPASPRR
jgi:hypothetical protein